MCVTQQIQFFILLYMNCFVNKLNFGFNCVEIDVHSPYYQFKWHHQSDCTCLLSKYGFYIDIWHDLLFGISDMEMIPRIEMNIANIIYVSGFTNIK